MIKNGTNPYFIKELETGYVVIGDYQHFAGYSLFQLAFGKDEMDLSIEDGTKYVKDKLERDYNKLSERTRNELKDRYENIKKVLFVDK